LSDTPAGSLRLWQASSESVNGVNIGFEPGMQADQWGAAASATSGVRSNVALDSGCCQLNFRCPFLPTLASRQSAKKSRKMSRLNAQIEVLHARFASTAFSYATARYALRFLALLLRFIQLEFL
jgi:hypothetical protein